MWKYGFGCLLLAACASPQGREDLLPQAEMAGMQRVAVMAEGFALTTLRRIRQKDAPVRIYVEGDGLAWITRSQPSADPTPRRPVGLALALADGSANVAYLARPCQYSLRQSPRCEPAYWTDRRFSETVVQAMNAAVDDVMRSLPGQKIELIGYSGGGAIAVLLAARRSDVSALRTVAGNLDHDLVNRHHHVSSMPASLNPVDAARQLAHLPQVHYYGERDTVIPPSIAQAFARRAGEHNCLKLVGVPDLAHQDGWALAWPRLLAIPAGCPGT